MTAGTSLLAFALADWPRHGVDDAQITLTYGQNIAAGEGFVFSRGGERVEGSTSLLWTLVCAAAALTPMPERTLVVVCWLLTAGAVYTTVAFLLAMLRRVGNGSRIQQFGWGAFPIAWCLTSPGFMLWNTVSLLDTALWCFVLTAGTLLFCRAAVGTAGPRSTLVLCAAVSVALVTRPEAMAFALLWIAGLWGTTWLSTGNMRAATRRAVPPAIAYVVTLSALVTFRLVYFGFPLPNTYYAKVSPDIAYNIWMGARYGGKVLLEYPILAVCGAICLAGIYACVKMGLQRSQRRDVGNAPELAWLIVAVVVLAALVQPLLTGGDHFELHRFYQPAWPLFIVPLLLWANAWFSRGREGGSGPWSVHWILASAIVAVTLSSGQSWASLVDPEGIRVEFRLANAGLKRGLLLNEFFEGPTRPSIGEVSAGGVGRTYSGRVVDLLGLNNVAMGTRPAIGTA